MRVGNFCLKRHNYNERLAAMKKRPSAARGSDPSAGSWRKNFLRRRLRQTRRRFGAARFIVSVAEGTAHELLVNKNFK